jgi:hypothetical protein
MSSNNPHLDKPQDVATRVSNFTQATKDPNLMHYRTKTGGAESRREQPIPILSGGMLQNHLSAINGRRNDVVKMMPKDVMDKWHIVLNPDGTSNIQIGRKQNHRNAYQTFDIDDNTASQIMALSDNPDTAAQAAQANVSKAAYIAQQVGMNKKKQGRTPDQIVQLVIEDKSYDACIYPFWDAERNLHSSTLQAMPMHAPQRMIPSNAYLEHRWHRQLCAWLVKDLKSNPEDMQKFRTLYINLPPITDIAQVRRYAGALKSVEAESTEIPEEELQRELISAGFNIEIIKKPDVNLTGNLNLASQAKELERPSTSKQNLSKNLNKKRLKRKTSLEKN